MKAVLFAALLLGEHSFAQQVCDTRSYPASAPAQRFEDHGDGTVTDRESKLMWMRCSGGQVLDDGACRGVASTHDWVSAQAYAEQINRSGTLFFNDWRVPQIRELAVLAERQCSNPRIDIKAFPNTAPGMYWTATSRRTPNAEAHAFALSFGADGVQYVVKSQPNHLRLVRNAH